MEGKYLYAARDKNTGKLVSDITNPRKKYWQRESACRESINNANRERLRYGITRRGELELVVFELVEVK
jgi:hypothetical protein